MNNSLNIERLHNVISKINSGDSHCRSRRVGYTTAYLQLMIGEVELGDAENKYVYVGENFRHAEQTHKQFLDLTTQEYGKDLIQSAQRGRCRINNKDFLFTSVIALLDNPNNLRGLRFNRAFVDISSATQYFYGERLIDALGMLYTHTNPDGDII